jgi:hypothetical protein
MCAKLKSSGFGMSVLSMAALLALASPMIAATETNYGKLPREAETALSLALQDTGGPAEKLSRLSLRLYGGFNRIAAGDINAGCDGYFEVIELYAASGYGTTAGGYSPLHAGYNFGADLIYQLSPTIGVGIGAGYMRNSRNSLMTWTDEGEITLTAEPTISAIPIRVGLFLTFPVASKINLTADIGGAYYAGLKFDAWQRMTYEDASWGQMALSASKSGNLGFQGSLGFEYKFSPKMGFFVEVLGRYARFENFASATATNEDSDGYSETSEGKIYVVGYDFGTMGEFDWITLEDTPPVVGDGIVSVREPKFDLSGFSLQAGIRIRF